MTVRQTIDDAAGGIGCHLGDARHFEHEVVDHSHVAVISAQENRPVRNVTIDQLRRRQPASESAVVIPFAPQKPAVAGQFLVEFLQAPAEFRFVLGIFQRHLA